MSDIQWGIAWEDNEGFVETYGTRDAAEQGLASVQGVWDSYNWGPAGTLVRLTVEVV